MSVFVFLGKIMDHKNSLQFPDDIEISPGANNLIQAFLCGQVGHAYSLIDDATVVVFEKLSI